MKRSVHLVQIFFKNVNCYVWKNSKDSKSSFVNQYCRQVPFWGGKLFGTQDKRKPRTFPEVINAEILVRKVSYMTNKRMTKIWQRQAIEIFKSLLCKLLPFRIYKYYLSKEIHIFYLLLISNTYLCTYKGIKLMSFILRSSSYQRIEYVYFCRGGCDQCL